MPDCGDPLPNVQSYRTIVCPAPAFDKPALKLTSVTVFGAAGEKLKSAVGMAPTPTATCLEVDAATPLLSVVVSTTVHAPAANRCSGVTPSPDDPSPKFQE